MISSIHSWPGHHPHCVSWASLWILWLCSCSAFSSVVINEIHYNGESNTAVNEFVELHNTGSDSINISGWSFSDGVDFMFPPGSEIVAGGYAVVAERPSSILSQFGVACFGPYSQNFSNGGEQVTLSTSIGGAAVASFTYQDNLPWPTAADGSGYSLIPLILIDQADGTLNDGTHWRASTTLNGSPGGPDL